MPTQETTNNDALAASFQELLIKELQSRGVPFTKATAENFANVNIDVHISIDDFWYDDLFKYIGIGLFKRDFLSKMTLEAYVKEYVDDELAELKSSVEYAIKENEDLLSRDTQWSENHKRHLEERLEAARKIATWLIKE
jgi:hypothetical protein